MIKKYTSAIFLFCMLFICTSENAVAQENPDPRGAFLRSLAVPGWGHFYADHENRTRGQIHLGTEITLIASYFGFRQRASSIESRYLTLANLRSGVNITDRSRAFQLAIGEFNNLSQYNDFQLRSRNWNRLIYESAENNWQWQSEDDRNKYNRLRNDRDNIRNQLPAILGLMTVNRVISAISAYNRAKAQSSMPEITLSPVLIESDSAGVLATMSFKF